MKLLRWCNWFDGERHVEVEHELEERQKDIIDMTARLTRLQAEIEAIAYGRRTAESRQQASD